MNLPRRLLVFALGGVVAALAIGGCKDGASPKQPTIAYVTNGVASFWTIAEAGAKSAAKELGVSLSVHMPTGGIADQKRILEDLLVRGIDGVAISLIDPQNQAALVDQVAEHTKLITHDSDAPGTKRLAYIGMDNYLAGRMCGDLVREALPNGGKIAIFIGRVEQDNARRRRQGVIDAVLGRSVDPSRYDPPGTEVSENGYTIVATLTDQFDRAKAKSNVEDIIARYPDLGAAVGLFAYNTPAIIEAFRQSGKLGAIKIVSFDEAEETLQGIADGVVYGTVVQNPFRYGFESVRLLRDLIAGKGEAIPAGGFIDIPARQIRRDTVGAFRSELQVQLSEGR